MNRCSWRERNMLDTAAACQEFNGAKCNMCDALLHKYFCNGDGKHGIVANAHSAKAKGKKLGSEGSTLHHIFLYCICHACSSIKNFFTNHCLVWTLILLQMFCSSDMPSSWMTDWSVCLFTPSERCKKTGASAVSRQLIFPHVLPLEVSALQTSNRFACISVYVCELHIFRAARRCLCACLHKDSAPVIFPCSYRRGEKTYPLSFQSPPPFPSLPLPSSSSSSSFSLTLISLWWGLMAGDLSST